MDDVTAEAKAAESPTPGLLQDKDFLQSIGLELPLRNSEKISSEKISLQAKDHSVKSD
ncbi:MAG: hypothetical protein Ta2B_30460 [Termitinemataceae bacterium]|nr:MAG: hypothetical protein Ta2B_30460 [Termitinemataceae bacterium]